MLNKTVHSLSIHFGFAVFPSKFVSLFAFYNRAQFLLFVPLQRPTFCSSRALIGTKKG